MYWTKTVDWNGFGCGFGLTWTGTWIGIRVSGILWILWIQWTQTTSVVCFILLFLLVASFLPPGRRMEAMVVEFDTFDSHPFVPTQWGLRDRLFARCFSAGFLPVHPCFSFVSKAVAT